jgi:hypothetical protein
MKDTAIGLLTILVVVIIIICTWGGHFPGVTVHGNPIANGRPSIDSQSAPSAWDAVAWVWDSVEFGFAMATFQIDNMPYIFNVFFDILGLLVVICIIFLARGSS